MADSAAARGQSCPAASRQLICSAAGGQLIFSAAGGQSAVGDRSAVGGKRGRRTVGDSILFGKLSNVANFTKSSHEAATTCPTSACSPGLQYIPPIMSLQPLMMQTFFDALGLWSHLGDTSAKWSQIDWLLRPALENHQPPTPDDSHASKVESWQMHPIMRK